jgi:SpoIID/LytB domain protein
MDTLKAQVVAARSYAVYAMRRYGLRRDCNCHLTDGAGDQVYIGYDREGGIGGRRWVSAVDRSRAQVVTYRGAVIQAFFAASDGGHSADVEDVWHGGNPAYAIPWLRGVCDPGESTDANPWVDWRKRFSASEVTARLTRYTGAIGTVKAFSHVRRGDSGRIIRVTVRGTFGKSVIDGTDLREALGLYDDRVWINADRNVLGPIREKYDGLMCAPGLATSARHAVRGGSQQFFQKGGIFRNEARTLTLWLKGGVFREYRAVGAGGGVLGLPIARPSSLVRTGARAASCSSCQRADFERGRIYGKRGTGVHALWGRVLDAYLARGGATGKLGFPLSRVRAMAGGGRRARFVHGRIVCPAGDPCRTVVV